MLLKPQTVEVTGAQFGNAHRCSKRGANAGVADKLWRGLNSYNFCPLLSEDVPRHSRCQTCPKCKKKFISGMEGSVSLPEHKDLCCLRCCGSSM
jgi:hypothetical protein